MGRGEVRVDDVGIQGLNECGRFVKYSQETTVEHLFSV